MIHALRGLRSHANCVNITLLTYVSLRLPTTQDGIPKLIRFYIECVCMAGHQPKARAALNPTVVVVGGAVLDVVAYGNKSLLPSTSNPGTLRLHRSARSRMLRGV